jgi:hypothetical protein
MIYILFLFEISVQNHNTMFVALILSLVENSARISKGLKHSICFAYALLVLSLFSDCSHTGMFILLKAASRIQLQLAI